MTFQGDLCQPRPFPKFGAYRSHQPRNFSDADESILHWVNLMGISLRKTFPIKKCPENPQHDWLICGKCFPVWFWQLAPNTSLLSPCAFWAHGGNVRASNCVHKLITLGSLCTAAVLRDFGATGFMCQRRLVLLQGR